MTRARHAGGRVVARGRVDHVRVGVVVEAVGERGEPRNQPRDVVGPRGGEVGALGRVGAHVEEAAGLKGDTTSSMNKNTAS